MYSFEIENINNGDRKIIFGNNWKNAFKREGLDPDDWDILFSDYED
jgi:hypothetical protein